MLVFQPEVVPDEPPKDLHDGKGKTNDIGIFTQGTFEVDEDIDDPDVSEDNVLNHEGVIVCFRGVDQSFAEVSVLAGILVEQATVHFEVPDQFVSRTDQRKENPQVEKRIRSSVLLIVAIVRSSQGVADGHQETTGILTGVDEVWELRFRVAIPAKTLSKAKPGWKQNEECLQKKLRPTVAEKGRLRCRANPVNVIDVETDEELQVEKDQFERCQLVAEPKAREVHMIERGHEDAGEIFQKPSSRTIVERPRGIDQQQNEEDIEGQWLSKRLRVVVGRENESSETKKPQDHQARACFEQLLIGQMMAWIDFKDENMIDTGVGPTVRVQTDEDDVKSNEK